MKTTYTAWAVQVLRDGEWVWFAPNLLPMFRTRWEARWCAGGIDGRRRVRKVRVTVEEV